MTRGRVCGGLAVFAAALVFAFGAPSALAQLPGGSAVDEYTENVPGAGGDHTGDGGPTNNDGDGDGDGGSGDESGGGTTPTGGGTDLPADPAASSASSGGTDSGSDSAGVNQSSGGGGSGDTSGGATAAEISSDRSGSAPSDAPATVTSQPTASAQQVDAGDGGAGALLPVAIAVVLLASIAIYWYRRRYPDEIVEAQRRGGLFANRLGT